MGGSFFISPLEKEKLKTMKAEEMSKKEKGDRNSRKRKAEKI